MGGKKRPLWQDYVREVGDHPPHPPRNKPVILKVVPYLIILIVATSLLTTKHVPKSRDFSKECGVSVLAGAA